MTLLNDALQEKKFDVRVVEKNLARGVVQDDEVQKLTKQLPDDAANASWVNLEELAQAEVEKQ
jgi:hypothetical protein